MYGHLVYIIVYYTDVEMVLHYWELAPGVVVSWLEVSVYSRDDPLEHAGVERLGSCVPHDRSLGTAVQLVHRLSCGQYSLSTYTTLHTHTCTEEPDFFLNCGQYNVEWCHTSYSVEPDFPLNCGQHNVEWCHNSKTANPRKVRATYHNRPLVTVRRVVRANETSAELSRQRSWDTVSTTSGFLTVALSPPPSSELTNSCGQTMKVWRGNIGERVGGVGMSLQCIK